MSKTKIYVKSILIPVFIGGIVGLIISGSIDYNSLQKPFLAPPSILFPIVWTILYILMGVSYGILATTFCKCNLVNNLLHLKMAFVCIYMDYFIRLIGNYNDNWIL